MRAALLAGGLLAGCTTHITTHPTARIYVDDALVGIGEAEIRRMGPPAEVVIRVEHEGVVVERTLERAFELSTLLLGVFTLYTGLYWGWSYPDEVHIDVPAPTENPWLPRARPAADPWAPPDT